MVAEDEVVAPDAARCADVLGHQDSRGQHGEGHAGLHSRGREPEEGDGAQLAHLDGTADAENRRGERQGRGGVDYRGVTAPCLRDTECTIKTKEDRLHYGASPLCLFL